MWLAVVLWIGVIFTTIPIVRKMQEALVERWPVEAIGLAVITVIAASTVIASSALHQTRRPLKNGVWILAVATITVLWIAKGTETGLRSVLLGIFAALLVCDAFASRRLRTPPPAR